MLLNVWEKGLNLPLLEKALLLLSAALPDKQPEELTGLSIGQRDRYLLQLREHLFGPRLSCTGSCPSCGEVIEWENKVGDFLLPECENDRISGEFDFCSDGYEIRFRLPNSGDIAAAAAGENASDAQNLLLSRCLITARNSDGKHTFTELPEKIIGALNQQIAARDPQAEIHIDLSCPQCSHRWTTLFDIAGFLWNEIDQWSARMLQTIHKLARGYGWNEQEILALSPVRRQLYSGMLG